MKRKVIPLLYRENITPEEHVKIRKYLDAVFGPNNYLFGEDLYIKCYDIDKTGGDIVVKQSIFRFIHNLNDNEILNTKIKIEYILNEKK